MNLLIIISSKEQLTEVVKKIPSEGMNLQDSVTLMHIDSYDSYFLGKTEEKEDLDYLYTKALELGGNVKIIRSNNVSKSIGKFAIDSGCDRVILGLSKNYPMYENIVKELQINKSIDLIC